MRKNWIDILKGIAIIAVVVDHAIGLNVQFYVSYIEKPLFFSITWFIFLTAVNSNYSIQKITASFLHRTLIFWRKKLNLILAYIIASILILIINDQQIPSLSLIVNTLFLFNAELPYYYFFILFQLYFIFPFVWLIIS
jgi:hypothetical protein